MIVGPRAASGLLTRAAVLTLAVAAALGVSAGAAAAATATGAAGVAAANSTASSTAGRPSAAHSWTPAWSWQSASGGLPKGCAAYSGSTSAGMRWSPSLVRTVGGRLRLGTSGGTAGYDLAGSGVGCKDLAQRYGLLQVRARMPVGTGLVGRIALWPSTTSQGSDWSGLTVPSADIGPAYVTNGCGNEAYGAAVPARLAGAFHDYVIAWSPQGFSVTVDGRTLYRDDKSFDRPRWLGISLSATGPSATRAQLMVEKVAAYSWSGPVPAAAGSTGGSAGGSAGASPDADTAATASSSGSQDSAESADALRDEASPPLAGAAGSAGRGTAHGGGTAHGPATAGAGGRGTGAANSDSALAAVLDQGTPSPPWLIAGALAALGVLLGIVRAARAARRRPVTPR